MDAHEIRQAQKQKRNQRERNAQMETLAAQAMIPLTLRTEQIFYISFYITLLSLFFTSQNNSL